MEVNASIRCPVCRKVKIGLSQRSMCSECEELTPEQRRLAGATPEMGGLSIVAQCTNR